MLTLEGLLLDGRTVAARVERRHTSRRHDTARCRLMGPRLDFLLRFSRLDNRFLAYICT